MFQNIRKQKEHAFQMGYQQSRIDMGLPPLPESDKPAPAAAAALTPRIMLETIERFGVAEDGGVKISAEILAVMRFMVRGADDADTPAGR